VSWERTGLL
jgi:hypothetical protein